MTPTTRQPVHVRANVPARMGAWTFTLDSSNMLASARASHKRASNAALLNQRMTRRRAATSALRLTLLKASLSKFPRKNARR
jgi:hypothetical protein